MKRPMLKFVDFSAVRIVEPPIVALPSRDDDLTIWRHAEDRSITIRIGRADEIGAATINIPEHLITATWTTLRAADGAL